MSRRHLPFLLLSLLLFTASAEAQPDPCDTDGDGNLTQAEIDACGPPPGGGGYPTYDEWLGLDGTDTSGDGHVDKIDYYLVNPQAWIDGPDAQDLNGDGVVDFSDFFLFADAVSAPPVGGDPCDANGDGVVDQFETDTCGGEPGTPPDGGEGYPTYDEWLGIDGSDTNGDGVVDINDYYLVNAVAWLEGPDGQDLDGDGFIGFADFIQYAESVGGGGPPAGDPCDMNGDGIVDDAEFDACGEPPPAPVPFEEWELSDAATDVDGDGQIDLKDWELFFGLAAGGDPCDLDGDGFLDDAEIDACGPPSGGDPCDLDGDGFVDEVELNACGPQHPPFEEWELSDDAMDVDGDGDIDVADWEAAFGLPPGGDPGFPTFDQWLATATDTNGDGVVNQFDYYTEYPDAWFEGPEADDLNGDGAVDFSDFIEFMAGPTDTPLPGDVPSMEEWLNSPEADDLNGDGEIDHLDFELFFGVPPGKPTFDEWFASGDATDVDGDGEITPLDYELFFDPLGPGPAFPPIDEWLVSPEAEDLNGDGEIDELDYDLAFGFGHEPDLTPEEWFDAPDADDLNGDGIVDILDYEIFYSLPPGDGPDDGLGKPPFDEWLASGEAIDMDGDGDITVLDYELFFDPLGPDFPPIEEWLAGPDAEDVNGDGEIDQLDYDLAFGIGHEPPDLTPEEWFDSPDAADLNDDGLVDILDYELFYGLPPGGSDKPTFDEWLALGLGIDLDGDGDVTIADYDLFFDVIIIVPTFEEWVDSGEAVDVDGDGEITRLDYDAFFSDEPFPDLNYEEWLAGPDAADLDGTGEIDEVDWEAYVWIDTEGEDLDGNGEIDFEDFTLSFLGGDEATGEIGDSPLSIDFDPAPGDQERRLGGNARAGLEYTLQLNIADVGEIKGWSVTINFDPTQVQPVSGSFQLASYLDGGLPLERRAAGEIGVGTTILTGTASGAGAGTLGSLKMRVLQGFTGSTDVEIVRYGLRPVDGEQLFQAVSVVVTISEESIGEASPADFDGDGLVDFPDFFLFADAFWTNSEQFDLTGDGFVDFRDFFLFSDFFGQQQPLFKLMALAEEMLGLPTQAALTPNYPNPFNGSTVLRFVVPQESTVRLRIYDVLGQQIRRLDPGQTVPGFHEVTWNGRNDDQRPVAAGVYLVALEGEGVDGSRFADVRKITLAE